MQTYDCVTGEFFHLPTVLLWTINDYPAHNDLSGQCTKGYQAYPICKKK